MAPAVDRRTRARRQPLVAATPSPQDQGQFVTIIRGIFNKSQHPKSSEAALEELKKLYRTTEYRIFDASFRDCVKKLLQAQRSEYFKTSSTFLCKFIQHVTQLADEAKARNTCSASAENASPTPKVNRPKRGRPSKGPKASRKRTKTTNDDSEDELIAGLVSTREASVTESDDEITQYESTSAITRSSIVVSTISDHDRLISSFFEVCDKYMCVADETCRLNAIISICKLLANVESLDEGIIKSLKITLQKRIRDRKPIVRAHAVLASRIFQDSREIQECFTHHFYRDPELIVRKALLQVMKTEYFGYNFLVDSTQDTHEIMRRNAYLRLSKISPNDLSTDQLHRVIHNGLNERDLQSAHKFKTITLWPWLSTLYDGTDLLKLLKSFDIVNYPEDVTKLLEVIYERNLDQPENNGTLTRLHHVVEGFRERWLDDNCLPNLQDIDEGLVTVWLSLLKYCKVNQPLIKSVKIRPMQKEDIDPNESIERILESQENRDEVVELYERLSPDLVNLVEFLSKYIVSIEGKLKKQEVESEKVEYTYQQIMSLISTYEIGDELERKTVQETFDMILRENLLIGHVKDFIPPIVKCLFTLVYSKSSNLMINYISELIQNVRSHLEDLAATSHVVQVTKISRNPPASEIKAPRSVKKVRIDEEITRFSDPPPVDPEQIEFRIATIQVEIEELRDQEDEHVRNKDYDQAKIVKNKIADLVRENHLLHDRRCSMASDVSAIGIIIDHEPDHDKLSSTMIDGNPTTNESLESRRNSDERDLSLFKHHPNELLKCWQMYFGCLQNVKVSQVPVTMHSHLRHLSHESLESWFKENSKIRCMMVACNGITALVDKEFATTDKSVLELLVAACFDDSSLDIKTVGFRCLVDVLCRYDEIPFPKETHQFLKISLKKFGKYDSREVKKNELEFISTVIEGTAKLFYLQKLKSPLFLSYLIIWWYHPNTHSWIKQFIGIFLPTFVNDIIKERESVEVNSWFRDLLMDTFVISVENLHDYILGPGQNIMAANDMLSLINFLCNLIPVSLHPGIADRIDDRIDELGPKNQDLTKYLKQARNNLVLNITDTDKSQLSMIIQQECASTNLTE